jgi:hypothetical protein
MIGSRERYRFEFTDWNLYQNTADTLVYRPGVKTLLRRLVWSVIAIVLIICTQYGSREAVSRLAPPDRERADPAFSGQYHDLDRPANEMREQLRGSMTEAEWRDFEARETENRARNQAEIDSVIRQREQIVSAIRYGAIALTILLAAGALLPPLLALFEQITIARNVRGDFTVTRRRLLTRTVACPSSTLSPVQVYARAMARNGGHGGRSHSGCRWIVSTESDPMQGGTGTGFDFHVDHWKHAPVTQDRLPERVAALVDGLNRLTGHTYEGPIILDSIPYSPKSFGARVHFGSRGPVVRTQMFTSLGDVPPELRGEIESMMSGQSGSEGSGIQHRVIRTEHITVKDADGNVRTFNSAEELPPEMRSIYEEMRRRHESDRK